MNVEGAVAPTDVRFTSMAVTPEGIVQLPFVPNTSKTTVSPGPTGVVFGPSGLDGRVSTSRHGAIGVTSDFTSSAAPTQLTPPAPIATATAAPMAAQRLRRNRERSVRPDRREAHANFDDSRESFMSNTSALLGMFLSRS
jgi:hypothetical protein